MSKDFELHFIAELGEQLDAAGLLPPASQTALLTYRNIRQMKIDGDVSLEEKKRQFEDDVLANAAKGNFAIPSVTELGKASTASNAQSIAVQVLDSARERALKDAWQAFARDRKLIFENLTAAYADGITELRQLAPSLDGVVDADAAIAAGVPSEWARAGEVLAELRQLRTFSASYRTKFHVRPGIDRYGKYESFEHPDRLQPERHRDDGGFPTTAERIVAVLASLHASPWLPSPAQQDELAQRELDARQAEQAKLEAQPGRMLMSGISAA